MKTMIVTLTLLVASAALAEDSVERDYLVKGMTCGGCVIGVKKALERAGISKDQIMEVDFRKPDPANKVGHAKVRFKKEQYKGQETDCKVVREIKDKTGFTAYWGASDTNPCKLN